VAVNARLRDWLRRYVPAEAAATSGALAGAALALGGGPARVALAATWGEAATFYAFVTGRELRSARPLAALRRVVAEFGVAEVCDTLLLRPLAMYGCSAALGSVVAGVLVGKVLADVAFYALAIPAYELRRRGAAS
jgi:hypothetical protein